jgi:hypothetical protein
MRKLFKSKISRCGSISDARSIAASLASIAGTSVSINPIHVIDPEDASMADKVFVILSSQDPEVLLEVGFTYPYNTAVHGWMEDVKIIFFGPSEKLVIDNTDVQARLKEALDAGIHVMACKGCSERMGITADLEALGIEVLYVGPVISDLLKEGWASLTF